MNGSDYNYYYYDEPSIYFNWMSDQKNFDCIDFLQKWSTKNDL